MNAAESNRRTKKEIADALKAQITALALDPTTLQVSGAGDDVNGTYTFDAGAGKYLAANTSNSISENVDGKWSLYEGGGQASYESQTTNLGGAWQIRVGPYAGSAPAPTVTPVANPLFGKVEVFDLQDLTDALKLLLDDQQRIAVIVMLDESFEPQTTGQKMFLTRTQPVTIIISDRVLGDRVKALWGGDDEQGAFALAEQVLPAVTGQLLSAGSGFAGVVSVPKNLYSIFLTSEDRQNLAGRAAVSLELTCSGGVLETRIDLGPTL